MASLDLSGDANSSIDKALNVGGAVTVEGALTVQGKVTANLFEASSGAYAGELYLTDVVLTSLSQAMFSSVWTQIQQWEDASALAGVTASTTAYTLTVNSSGVYYVSCALSLLTTRAGEYELEAFSGGTSQDNLKARVYVPTSTQNNPVAASFSGILSLASGAALDVRGRSTGGGSVLLNNGNFSAFKVG